MLFSGIDLHKRSLVIHTLDAEGVTTREAELRNDRAAVMAYFATLAGPMRGEEGSLHPNARCTTNSILPTPPNLASFASKQESSAPSPLGDFSSRTRRKA